MSGAASEEKAPDGEPAGAGVPRLPVLAAAALLGWLIFLTWLAFFR